MTGELRKEVELADAGCTDHADEVGEALEKIEGVLEGLSELEYNQGVPVCSGPL